MGNPSIKQTRKTISEVVDQTIRLIEHCKESEVDLFHRVRLDLSQTVVHEQEIGTEISAEIEADLRVKMPADVGVEVGRARESERAGDGSIGGIFEYTITFISKNTLVELK